MGTKPKLVTKTKRKKPTRPNTRETVLTETLYCYVEPDNARHAKTVGKDMFGTFSSYVNALIAKDRGATPQLGSKLPPGESRRIRKEKRAAAKKREGHPEKPKVENRPKSVEKPSETPEEKVDPKVLQRALAKHLPDDVMEEEINRRLDVGPLPSLEHLANVGDDEEPFE